MGSAMGSAMDSAVLYSCFPDTPAGSVRELRARLADTVEALAAPGVLEMWQLFAIEVRIISGESLPARTVFEWEGRKWTSKRQLRRALLARMGSETPFAAVGLPEPTLRVHPDSVRMHIRHLRLSAAELAAAADALAAAALAAADSECDDEYIDIIN